MATQMDENEKQFKLDKLGEAYLALDEAFNPVSLAMTSTAAAGYDVLSHEISCALDMLQRVQDVLRENRGTWGKKT